MRIWIGVAVTSCPIEIVASERADHREGFRIWPEVSPGSETRVG